MVGMTFNKQEAFLMEKMCDDQAVVISKRIREVAESFFVARARMNLDPKEREKISKMILNEIEEFGETSELLKSIRNKFEAKRK